MRIAEARGLVGMMRRLVLEKAAALTAVLPQTMNLWINASVHDLRQPGMVNEMLAELENADLPQQHRRVDQTGSGRGDG